MFSEFQKNLPPDFMEYKSWGFKYIVHDSPSCQVHLCCIKKGGYSSWHHHDYRFNRFIVLEGKLRIKTIYKITKGRNYTIGDDEESRKFDVKPGIRHKFIALTDVQLLEVYYTVCSDKDIIRQDKGGMKYEE